MKVKCKLRSNVLFTFLILLVPPSLLTPLHFFLIFFFLSFLLWFFLLFCSSITICSWKTVSRRSTWGKWHWRALHVHVCVTKQCRQGSGLLLCSCWGFGKKVWPLSYTNTYKRDIIVLYRVTGNNDRTSYLWRANS